MGNKTQYERDDNGNVTKTINPDGTFTMARYNDKNMPLVQVDESNNVVINEYDNSGVNVVKNIRVPILFLMRLILLKMTLISAVLITQIMQ